MTLQGNYEDIRRFIYHVESGSDFIVIDSVSLRQGEEAGSPLDVGACALDLLPGGARWTLNVSARSRSVEPRCCSLRSRCGACSAARRHPRAQRVRARRRRRAHRQGRNVLSPKSISKRSKWSVPSPKREPETHSGSNRSPRHRRHRRPSSKQQQQAAAAAAAAAVPVGPPPPPRIPLKYIGDMTDPKNPGKKIAILSDARGSYYGREGEVIEGRYRIIRIGVESIELAYLDGRGRQTIRQTGQ